MANRSGILSRLRHNIKRKKGGSGLYKYLLILLKDPCVYCGEFGCDSIDHITPKSKDGVSSWENYAPTHRSCNSNKDSGGVLWRWVK